MLLENMFDFLTKSLKKPKNTLMSYVTLRNGIFFHSCHILSKILAVLVWEISVNTHKSGQFSLWWNNAAV